MLNKVVSVLLVSLFIISMIPITSLAQDPSPGLEANAPGGDVTTAEELIAALGGKSIAYENGIITLYRDVVLAKSINIKSGSYTLVGKGATVKANFDGDIFIISGEETTLAFGMTSGDPDKSDLIFDGGNDVRSGSVIRVERGAKVNLNNSVLVRNVQTSTSGAAIYNEGTFVLNGGKIESCRASSWGGAIYSTGNLFFKFGSIQNCSANQGGAVYSKGEAVFESNLVKLTKCNATDGGAIYNEGKLEYNATEITECSADKRGGAIYNNGNAKISGGTISKNTSEKGDGGGIYNASDLELADANISENSAKNGGNVYNSGTVTTGSGVSLNWGVASEKGGNVYNSEHGIFTQSGGAISLGKAVYGGGVFNLGTYNLSGGGIYSNKAHVAEGLLNHGKFVLAVNGFCQNKDDIFVVLTPENKHAILVAENWEYNKKPIPISSGTFDGGKYSYSHSAGNKLLDIKGKIDVDKRFVLHISNTGLILNEDGTLSKASLPVSKTLVTIICAVLSYPLVTAVIVLAIRYFDKKKLSKQTETK